MMRKIIFIVKTTIYHILPVYIDYLPTKIFSLGMPNLSIIILVQVNQQWSFFVYSSTSSHISTEVIHDGEIDSKTSK